MNETPVTITMLLPDDLMSYIKECGPVDWGSVKNKTDEQHVADFANSLRITREHFKTEGNADLHGTYLKGTDTVHCHTGTSPNSALRGRILAGLWNAIHDTIVAQAGMENP